MNTHILVWSSLAMQADLEIAIEADPGPASAPMFFLWWSIETLSLSGLFVVLLGLAIFIGACRVVAKSRRTSAIAAYLTLLPLPTYIGVLGVLKGILASFFVFAASSRQPSLEEWARGIGGSVLIMFVCLLVTLPSYLVLAYGLLASTRNSSTTPTP